MRSKTTQKIIDSTQDEIRESVREYANELAYIAGATAELERSEKLLQEYREVNKELTSVLSEMYLADFGGNSRTIEEAMKRALKSSVYEQRIISIIKKGLNLWKQSKNF